MRRNNQWTGGEVEPKLPPLPDHLQGRTGYVPMIGTWDEAIGPEVYLVLLEGGVSGTRLAMQRPSGLVGKVGPAATDYGDIVFMLFSLLENGKRMAFGESFLNPREPLTLTLLSGLAEQTHLKVVVCDSNGSEVQDCFEFENAIDVREALNATKQCLAQGASGDFLLAQKQFVREHSVEELWRM